MTARIPAADLKTFVGRDFRLQSEVVRPAVNLAYRTRGVASVPGADGGIATGADRSSVVARAGHLDSGRPDGRRRCGRHRPFHHLAGQEFKR